MVSYSAQIDSAINNNMIFQLSASDEQPPKKLQLYTFFTSPPAFSVRIALNLKELDYECIPVNLSTGEQLYPDFLNINPLGNVPALKDGNMVLAESYAILLYLEEKYPQHPLLPCELEKRAINYQVANIVTSSIQALLRLPVLGYIRRNIGPDEKISWVHKHLGKGFAALEKLLKDHAGKYATGDEIFLADLLLAPYVIGFPQNYDFDLSVFPFLSRLSEEYMKVPAIQNAMPENQPEFRLF